MFASNTCTVESLSKDTVSITSLTALWNSVTLPSTWRQTLKCLNTVYQQAHAASAYLNRIISSYLEARLSSSSWNERHSLLINRYSCTSTNYLCWMLCILETVITQPPSSLTALKPCYHLTLSVWDMLTTMSTCSWMWCKPGACRTGDVSTLTPKFHSKSWTKSIHISVG